MAVLKFYRRKFYFHDPSPAMLKAMLVAGATPLTNAPDRHDGPEYDGSPSNHKVDRWPGYEEGFGLLTLNTLFDRTMYNWWSDQQVVLTQAAPVWSRVFTIDNGSRPTKITVAWTDVPASANATISIINQLTLEADFPDCSSRYFGNSTGADNYSVIHSCRTHPTTLGGPSDTVSIISIPAGRYASGTTFTVKISGEIMGAAKAGLGVPNQDFALYALNAR